MRSTELVRLSVRLSSRRRLTTKSRRRLAEGMRISSVSRVKGHKEDTVLDWLKQAADHAQEVEEVLLAEYQVTRGQLDALWSYVGHKGEKKVMLRPPSREPSGVPR